MYNYNNLGIGFSDPLQTAEMDAEMARRNAQQALKDRIRNENQVRNSFERVNRRGTRKGFIVLLGLLAIIAWFVYYYVIDQNDQLFFAMVLILVLLGAYAFWKMVRNDGALIGNTF